MKKTLLFIFPLFLLFNACSIRESIIDTDRGIKIVGYDKDCVYQIGKTQKNSLPQTFLDQMGKDSLSIYLIFQYASNSRESETLIAGWTNDKYVTSRGLKSGDSMEKALKLYGKPVATDLLYWEDKEHRIRWSFEGLFYPNMAILIDTSKNNMVRGVSVGNQFEVDKKFRRKSAWFKK
jgi:hypothetical protein